MPKTISAKRIEKHNEAVRSGKVITEAEIGNEYFRLGPVPKAMGNVIDTFRHVKLVRPCKCGCDERGGTMGVGYITGATIDAGFTVWIKEERTYLAIQAVFRNQGLHADE